MSGNTPSAVAGVATITIKEERAETAPTEPRARVALAPRPISMPLPLDEEIAQRVLALLERTGDAVPELRAMVLEQAERGLYRAVLAYTENHLGRAAAILGIDRNTCAKKARLFGLNKASRGRKRKSKA